MKIILGALAISSIALLPAVALADGPQAITTAKTHSGLAANGANIGAVRRHVFDMDGNSKDFISGYSNLAVPNLWDRSVAA